MMTTTTTNLGESLLSSPDVPLNVLRNSIVPQANLTPVHSSEATPGSPTDTTFFSGFSPGAYSHAQPTPMTVVTAKGRVGPEDEGGEVRPQYCPESGYGPTPSLTSQLQVDDTTPTAIPPISTAAGILPLRTSTP